MDEEAKGPLAQGHTAGLHAAGGFKPGQLPPKIVSLHEAKGSRPSGLWLTGAWMREGERMQRRC